MEAGGRAAGPGAGAEESSAEQAADAALLRFLPNEEPVVRREHRVTAVLVSRAGQPWASRAQSALATQVERPRRILAVDGAAWGGLADDRLGADDQLDDEAVRVGDTPAVEWLWIVPDDAAPEVRCLAELLAGADRHPEAHVLIPKSVAWADRTRLVGIGNMWAPGMPVVERIEPAELDQGQFDYDRVVYSGSLGGMLVRADTWRSLGGLDGRYHEWGSSADLCRRVWGAGHVVVFIPSAVVARARVVDRPGSTGSSQAWRSRRRGELLLELSQAPAAALPWRWVRGWLSSVVRILALLMTREPEDAGASLEGAWDVLGHPGRVRAARKRLRQPPVLSTERPDVVRASRGVVLGHGVTMWTAQRARPRLARRPSGATIAALSITAVLAVLAALRAPEQVFGSGHISGGGLLPAPGAREMLSAYLSSWQDVRFGLPTQQPAYLPILALASVPLLGSVDVLLRVLVGLGVPLAFLSAYASLGRGWPVRVRIPGSLLWALAPAGVAAMSAGRMSTLAVLLLGPPAVRALARVRSGGDARVHPAIVAGTILGILAAFAPLVLPAVAVTLAAAWAVRGPLRWSARSGLIVLGVALVFPVLWVPRAVRAPWLLLTDVGRSDPILGEPGSATWGLHPGGPGSAAWAGTILLGAAFLAVLVRGSARHRLIAPFTGAIALLVGSAWAGPAISRLWPQVPAGDVWPGVAVLVATGLLLVVLMRAAADWTPAGGESGPSRQSRSGDGGSRLRAAPLALLVVPMALAWSGAPVITTVRAETALPPVVALAADSAERPRALVLDRDGSQVTFAVATAGRPRLGDADALAAELDPAFSAVVSDLVAGSGADLSADLGRRAVRFVVLVGDPTDPIGAVLDSSVGLRRLATADEAALWIVGGEPSRVQLLGPGNDQDLAVPVATRPTSVRVVLHPQTPMPRILLVSEAADGGWTVSLDGVTVPLTTDGQGMSAARVTAPGLLEVDHRSAWGAVAIAHLAVMAGLVVLSLPKRRGGAVAGEGAL